MCEGYCTKYDIHISLPKLDVCVIDPIEKLEFAKVIFLQNT